MIPGYDISSMQGVLRFADWQAMRKAVGWASLRCGNGNNGTDRSFAANLGAARAVGLPVVAMHVLFPLRADGIHYARDPATQALLHFQGAKGLRPVVDLEWPEPQNWATWGLDAKSILAWALAYLAAMEKLTGGVKAAVYIYPDYEKHLVAGAGDLSALAAYPLWIARYGVAQPGTLAPWAAPTLWQKSDGGGKLPNGCPVDEDVFLGSDEELAAFVGMAA